jgi:hypothetical protein
MVPRLLLHGDISTHRRLEIGTRGNKGLGCNNLQTGDSNIYAFLHIITYNSVHRHNSTT